MSVYSKAVASIANADVGNDEYPHGGFIAVLSTPSEDRDGERVLRKEWIEPLPDRVPLDVDHGMTVADTIGSYHPYFEGETLMMKAWFADTPKAQEVRNLVRDGHVTGVSVAFLKDKSLKAAGSPFREMLNAGIVVNPCNRDATILAVKAATALVDALKPNEEGEVPEEIKEAVLKALRAEEKSDDAEMEDVDDEDTEEKASKKKPSDEDDAENEADGKSVGTVYVDVVPRIDEEALKNVVAEVLTKAGQRNSGADAAMLQAVHDAAVHLGAQCVVEPDVDPNSGASEGANKSLTAESFTAALEETLGLKEVCAEPAAVEAAADVESAAAEDAASDASEEKKGVSFEDMLSWSKNII